MCSDQLLSQDTGVGLGWGWGDVALCSSGWPFTTAGSSKASEEQCLSPAFWVQGFCVHHTFLLAGWKGCPIFLYPQGPSVGPGSFPGRTGGGFLWDLVAAKLQIHLLWVTVASCSGVTSHRHLLCLSDTTPVRKNDWLGALCKILYFSNKEEGKLNTCCSFFFFLLQRKVVNN